MTELILPDGYTTRPATLDDAQIVTDVLNAEVFHILGEHHFSLEECLQEWGEPGFDLTASSQCVFAPDGRLAGYVEVWDNDELPTRMQPFGATHPDFFGLGVGTYMLRWAEQRCRQSLTRVPADVQARMLLSNPGYQPGIELLQAEGFSYSRSFLRMEIDLNQEMPTAVFPDRFVMKTLPELGLRPMFDAYDEAFRDHWGYVALEDKSEKFARFEHVTNDPSFLPDLYWGICDGDGIVAVGLCLPKSNEEPSVGHVYNLGVRPQWRKQGLALNLLYFIFDQFKQRGFKKVALEVDSNSLTGATRLYERAGMVQVQDNQVWEKVIQEGRVLEAE